MKLSELIYKEEITNLKKALPINTEIKRITTRPDEIDQYSIFVFLKSARFNVEKLKNYVVSKNPAVIIAEPDINIECNDITIINVENTRRMLAKLYARFYRVDFSKIKFIGVTGTNGKTTTATLISEMLMNSQKSVGFIGTGQIKINRRVISEANYSMTTPDPDILYKVIKEMEKEKCEYIVIEVSSHAIYFEKTIAIPFEVSIFTNLSSEHMDFHKNIEDYYQTKKQLFSQSKLGIFNMDDIFSSRAYKETNCQKTNVGIVYDAVTTAKRITFNGLNGSEYIYSEPGLVFKVSLQLAGAYNVYNSLLALKAVIALGIRPYEAREALKKIDRIDGRLEKIHDDITVIIDYAHTPAAMDNLLQTLKKNITIGNKLITVFGCGGERDKSKRPLMASISEKHSDIAIVTSDNSRNEKENDIINDILKGFNNDNNRKVISDREKAIEYAILTANAGDIVALCGKGHEKYNITNSGYHEFDERKIIAQALEKRKGLSQNSENKT